MRRFRCAMRMKDSLTLEDSLRFYSSFDVNNPAVLHYPDGDKSVFYEFFAYLRDLKKNDTSMHILHYGDSQLEGDRITEYIRERLQDEFGGWGVGMLPPRPLTQAHNMAQSFSDNWVRQVPFGPVQHRAKHYRYGPILTVCTADSGNATVYLTPRRKGTEHVKKYDVCKVFYNGRSEISLGSVSGERTVTNKYYGGGLTIKEWRFDTFQKSASFTFVGDSTQEVYGISLECKVGVNVNNVPMRGASGTFFRSVDSALMYHSFEQMNLVGMFFLLSRVSPRHSGMEESFTSRSND